MGRQPLQFLTKWLLSRSRQTLHIPPACRPQCEHQQQWHAHRCLCSSLPFFTLASTQEGFPSFRGSGPPAGHSVWQTRSNCSRNDMQGAPQTHAACCWMSHEDSLLQRAAEEGSSRALTRRFGVYVRANSLQKAEPARCFSSLAEPPETDHVMLSKERLDQLLLAEITEFSLRPSRPLTLEQIAFLNKPRQQELQQHHSSSSSSSHTEVFSGAVPERESTGSLPSAASSPSHNASASCRAVLGLGSEPDARGVHFSGDTREAQRREGANPFAEFLYHELPVRFASRVKQLESLPLFHTEPLVMQVRHTYVESFKQLRTSCVEDPEAFRKVVLDLKRRHAPIVPMVVTGIRNLREVAPQFFTEKFVDEFLDGFFLSRIGTEMLTSSYLTPSGVVDMACDPFEVTKRAVEDAERLCHSHYGTCPQIKIWNFNEAHFASVPQYLYYILSELLKNAMRATMEHHPPPLKAKEGSLASSGPRPWQLLREDSDRWEADASLISRGAQRERRGAAGGERLSQAEPQYQTAKEVANPNMPPVQLLVAGDDHSISIRLSDVGGGITAEALPRIWSYMYTTARPVKYDPLTGAVVSAAPQQQQQAGSSSDASLNQSVTIGSLDFTTKEEKKQLLVSPLAGFGCGLPLCRLYASYLGGSLTLISMPVHGTDAYIHLRRIGDQKELMPSDVWLKPNIHHSHQSHQPNILHPNAAAGGLSDHHIDPLNPPHMGKHNI